MNVQAIIGGNDVSAWIMDTERTEKLCSPGQAWLISLTRDCPYTILPWHQIVLREEGTKVLTGYVSAVSDEFSKKPHLVVEGIDTWKRATDYWITAEYETSGDDILGLIAYFLNMCGLDHSINGEWWIPMPDGLVIPIQPISEILTKLAAAVNLFYRIDEDGVVQVGDVINDGGSGPAITTGVNLLNFDLIESDYRARNKVIVWGPNDYAVVRMDADWAVVDHTMVYANPYIPNANTLANSFLQSLHTLERVKTCEVLHDPDRRVGQKVSITAPTFTGDDICTTLHSRYSKSGKTMTAIHGERCAIFGGLDNTNQDGKDIMVATFECGVWRCKDIWAASPHWEPLNTGLLEGETGSDQDSNSTFKCEWLVWDPFRPLTTGFLLTYTGIFRTDSFEPGYENWVSVLPNRNLGMVFSDYEWEEKGTHWWISRLRTTIALEGAMYFTASFDDGDGPRLYIGHTLDRFVTALGGNDGEAPGCYTEGTGPPRNRFDTYPLFYSGFWGDCNYNHQRHVALPSWHHKAGYLTPSGAGSLETWNRGDHGCTVTALGSCMASNATPSVWHANRLHQRLYSGRKWYEVDEVVHTYCLDGQPHPFFCFGYGTPLPCAPPGCPRVWIPSPGSTMPAASANVWMRLGACHIPYQNVIRRIWEWDHIMGGRYEPVKMWLSPGYWQGSITVLEAEWPVGPNGPCVNIPWGGTPGVCNDRHGCVETFTHNANKVFLWSGDKPAKFATSLDEGLTWTQVGQVNIYAGSFSGFPSKWGIMYVGRDPVKDPTTAGDNSLVFATRDGGATFLDVTGDLWTQTRDMNLRFDQDEVTPLGASGIVTVLPMWSH
jgi:hypothetical protein